MFPCSLKKIILLLLAVSFLATMLPRRTQACGPFFTDAIFVYEKHPDFPLEKFARGQLGVLQPSYARSYLVAAYRNLSGEKLSDTEVNALKAVWEERINLSWESNEDEWIKKWNEARAKVSGLAAAPEIRVYRNREKPNEYETFLNCQQDAFDAATATLNDRISRFGADSAAARDWATTQDVVFGNCGGGNNIPAASDDRDEVIRASHTYQIAAANFYATHYEEATKQFDSIAKDNSSPWHLMAPYLAARAMLRKGSLAEKEEQGTPALTEAENRLNAVLANRELARSHHAAERLLNLTRLRLDPEEKTRELGHAIARKGQAADFKQSVWDYTVLLDKYLGEEEVKADSLPETIRTDELSDWIVTFQDQSDASTNHAVEQWQKKHSVTWLVSAISKATARSPQMSDLLEAAARIEPSASSFPSVVFHRVRLLAETNRANEARALLNRTLAGDRSSFNASAINLLVNQRMLLAQTLGDFLRDAQRAPAGFSDNEDGREVPVEEKEMTEITGGGKLFLDTDAAGVFNKMMPIEIFANAARSEVLAANLHRDVAQAAFMRATLLDQAAAANQVATILGAIHPEMKEFLAAYQQAHTPDARRFAAAYLALKFPGLRPFVTSGVGRNTGVEEIDSYRDNWWCAEPPTTSKIDYYEGDEAEQKEAAAKKTMPVPEFLKNSKAEAGREMTTLQALGTGPNYLAQTVINWASKNPADQRVPEALHLAVKSTRYGCTDKETGRWSKAAFDLLHRKYPNTSWAKETKYWFKG